MSDASTLEPRVSVVMATYNGEKFLLEQLESIAAQTLAPLEVIIRDDGSSDDTLEIARRFASRSRCPVLVRESQGQRLGYAENFAKAASAARGDLVAFSDQDDIWHPAKLATAARVFSRSDVVLAVHRSYVVDETGAMTGRRFPAGKWSGTFGLDLPLDVFPGFSMVVRSRLLRAADYRQVSGPTGSRSANLSHDTWVWSVAPCLGSTVVLPDLLAWYRQHDAATVGERHRTFAERANYGDASRFREAARHNRHIACCLREMEAVWALTDGTAAERAEQMATARSELATVLAGRARIYEGESRIQGARTWFAMVSSGGYGRAIRRPSQGALVALKDLTKVALGDRSA
ncbi:glycosyltransferase [Acidimicrobiaceae bacterium USS-CC1]|uniref:Glycosyltransferase n=1 Tax=Acidiferrimicrobium australe TaxID=2664430 RepID=A0ABW9QSD9_9ACTN|nr:glycosyltransferase [Acidiferrimicrobium australe]